MVSEKNGGWFYKKPVCTNREGYHCFTFIDLADPFIQSQTDYIQEAI